MKNASKFLAWTICATVFFTSCNNPLDRKFSKATFEEDAKAIGESKKLSEDDAKMLIGYITLSSLGGQTVEGKSYQEILDAAKKLKSDREELAKAAQKEASEKEARLGSIVTVALYDKGFEKQTYQEYIQYGIAFQNNSDKDIRAIKGSLLITDLFDTEIKRISIVMDDGIPANQVIKNIYTTEYNQFQDEDVRLASKGIDDIKAKWLPEKILFADGTSLE